LYTRRRKQLYITTTRTPTLTSESQTPASLSPQGRHGWRPSPAPPASLHLLPLPCRRRWSLPGKARADRRRQGPVSFICGRSRGRVRDLVGGSCATSPPSAIGALRRAGGWLACALGAAVGGLVLGRTGQIWAYGLDLGWRAQAFFMRGRRASLALRLAGRGGAPDCVAGHGCRAGELGGG
jgi:hypothetical protein